jgi:beta-glucanase (GH16 family)
VRAAFLAVCGLLGLTVAASAAGKTDAPRVPDLPGWALVWHDEFEGDRLDASKWTAEDAALEKNNEEEYYSPEAVSVKGGVLTLASLDKPQGGRKYTSGLVETRGKFARVFGRFEVRAKLPKGQGIWPAHWLMPDDNGWPPEIDIMEMLGHNPRKVYGSNHWDTPQGPRNEVTSFEGPDFSAGWHTFAVEWEPDEIRWYVDGVLTHRTAKNVPKGPPFRIILNTAVGGNWPRYPDKTTVFPQYHEIDYVRVWARDNIDLVEA